MDWLKQKLIEALTGAQPISKKLLVAIGAGAIAIVVLINSLANGVGVQAVASVPKPQASVASVVKSAQIYVHIVGAVSRPGIYQLSSGDRVVDAVFAAGGFAEKADQASINLAREVTDGEQVLVFKIGEAPTIIGSASTAGGASRQISLNRASQSELESLPGVGPALAARIIDWRSANGGFKKKEDLLNISGIGDKLFAGVKNQVTL